MTIDTTALAEYAALHDDARRVLKRLEDLDLDSMPAGLRARLLDHRASLEALIEVTDPAGGPLLESVFNCLGRPLPIDELWATVRWFLR